MRPMLRAIIPLRSPPPFFFVSDCHCYCFLLCRLEERGWTLSSSSREEAGGAGGTGGAGGGKVVVLRSSKKRTMDREHYMDATQRCVQIYINTILALAMRERTATSFYFSFFHLLIPPPFFFCINRGIMRAVHASTFGAQAASASVGVGASHGGADAGDSDSGTASVDVAEAPGASSSEHHHPHHHGLGRWRH
jgi:hypothetical protein